MKFPVSILAALLIVATNATADSIKWNPKLGKIKAPSCQFCHGIDGTGVNADYPNLNHQHAESLFDAMKAYQDGERKGSLADIMKQQLSKFNNQDLADIAAYYAGMN